MIPINEHTIEASIVAAQTEYVKRVPGAINQCVHLLLRHHPSIAEDAKRVTTGGAWVGALLAEEHPEYAPGAWYVGTP